MAFRFFRQRLFSACLCLAGLSSSVCAGASAQIASPSNAGQNSGNNASGSSIDGTISTPNFSPAITVPVSPYVTIDPDGVVTASPEFVTAVDASIGSVVATEQASILAQVVTANTPSPLTGPESLIPDVSVGIVGASTPELVSLGQVSSKVIPLDQVGQSITVSRPSIGASGIIAVNSNSLDVTVQGQTAQLPTTDSNQLELIQFASVSIAIGLAPTSIAASQQVV